MHIFLKLISQILIKFRSYETPFKRRLYKFLFKKKKHQIHVEGNKKIKDGFFKCTFEELKKNNLENEINDVFLKAKNIFDNPDNINSTGTKKYLRNFLENGDEKSIKTFLDFVLNEYFVTTVKEYLEEEPLLVELKLLLSPSNLSLDQQFKGSQLFHRDFDDVNIVKLFFCLSDVDDESGPLQILNSKISNQITQNNRYNFSMHSDKVENSINKEKDIITLKGKRGDCFLVDTSKCFHRGSRSVSKNRYILYANFSTRSNFRFPPIFLNNKNKAIISNHSPLAKYDFLVDKKKSFYLRNI